jgi:nicotinate-nucleotide adenylyltransferase
VSDAAGRRVGILGGTFDPPHNGHLALATAARDQLGLEQVVFIPAGQPPHKVGRPITAALHRLAMVELAVAPAAQMAVERIEIDRPGPSFTVDTLDELCRRAAAAGRPIEPTLIMSSDAFAELSTWRKPDRIVALAGIAVATRPGHPPPDVAAVGARIPGLLGRVDILDGPHVDISATEIRRRVAIDEPIDGLLPDVVARYIDDHDLYRDTQPEDTSIVTEPAEPTAAPPTATGPRADGLPSRDAVPASERPPLDVARRIVELAEDKKAADIVLLDLGGLTTLADAFVICSGGSERQLDAIADGIIEGMRAEKIRPIGREGTAASHWVLIDFGSVVVHIFTPPERDYYSLEKHWAEARTVLRVQ